MAVMKTMKMAEMMTIILAVATVAKLTTGFRKTSTTVPFELGSPDPTLGAIIMNMLFVGCFGGSCDGLFLSLIMVVITMMMTVICHPHQGSCLLVSRHR